MKNSKTTTCSKCNKVVTYKTKKPKFCKECNPVQFYKKPAIPQRSALEFKVQNWVSELFPDRPYIVNGYYSWLKSPKGYPMQIDLFLYGTKPCVAIEIEGIQHEQKQYFQTQEEFDYLRECDRQKEWMLKDKDIILVKVYPDCQTKEHFINLLYKHKISVA